MEERTAQKRPEHILACLSSAPSNGKIIRTAARMAEAFGSQFTALYVQTPDFSAATPENKQRLQDNRKLAERLGANIEIVYGNDVPYQIAECARLLGITRIVLGQSAMSRKHRLGKPTLTEQLIAQAPNVDIHIIPDRSAETTYRPRKARQLHVRTICMNSLKSIGILAAVTLVSILFDSLGFSKSTIIMMYLLGVLLTSISVTNRIYGLLSSVTSVLVFNYLFTTPRFSLSAYETGYPVTFLVMFLTAYITATFAIRYKEQARQSAMVAHRTKILFDTGKLLSKAENKTDILQSAAAQIIKLLERNLVVFDGEDGVLSEPQMFGTGKIPLSFDRDVELPVAQWVLDHNRSAGATTEHYSDAQYLYLALRVNDRVYGVMGIEAAHDPLDAFENSILLSLLGECALALENEKNAREKEAAAVMMESEQLRANLLRTISHDLRTPLTSISGNASNLLCREDSFDAPTRRQIYSDIYDDSIWLISLVENLLYATRIEENQITLSSTAESVQEILDSVLQHMERKSPSHVLTAVCENAYLLVRADAKLVVQVLINLLDNAIKYTPSGGSITLGVRKERNHCILSVSDTGAGISAEELPKVVERFYRCDEARKSQTSGHGLGLSIARIIVSAHGGKFRVRSKVGAGTTFSVEIPLEGE